ncbi:MAG TPA: hypothetical protein VFW28_09860 [Micropepsaceae bacterium]|nr:hypothetical protein [Micropepsaceae bacterium]
MHLIQILLPAYDNEGHRFPQEMYRAIGDELVSRFSGLTAYNRAPAEGFWTTGNQTARDEILVFEVMAQNLDENWWAQYRRELEGRLRQESVVIRAHAIRLL